MCFSTFDSLQELEKNVGQICSSNYCSPVESQFAPHRISCIYRPVPASQQLHEVWLGGGWQGAAEQQIGDNWLTATRQ